MNLKTAQLKLNKIQARVCVDIPEAMTTIHGCFKRFKFTVYDCDGHESSGWIESLDTYDFEECFGTRLSYKFEWNNLEIVYCIKRRTILW